MPVESAEHADVMPVFTEDLLGYRAYATSAITPSAVRLASCVRRSGKCCRTLARARCLKRRHDRAARQSSLLMVAVSALFWLATAQTGRAQQLPQAEVKWNEARYRCYGVITGQIDENTRHGNSKS